MPAGYKQPIMKTSAFLLLALQIFCKMNMLANECYQFVDQQESLSMIRGDEGTLFTLKPQVLPGARIGVFFELPDGRVIVIYPINGPKQGLMLNGMDCLKDMIAKGRIPLEEPDPDFLTRSNHLITGPDNLFGHHSGYLAATWGRPMRLSQIRHILDITIQRYCRTISSTDTSEMKTSSHTLSLRVKK